MTLSQNVIAVHSNYLVPPIWSYCLYADGGAVFDIELIGADGRTLGFLESVTLSSATATSLRTLCNNNVLFDQAVGALIRPVNDILFNTCVDSSNNIPSGNNQSPKSTTISKWSGGSAYGIGWG